MMMRNRIGFKTFLGGILAATVVIGAVGLAPAAGASEQPPVVTSDAAPVQLTAQQEADVNGVGVGANQSTKTFSVANASAAGASPQAVAEAASILAASGWTIQGSTTAPVSARVASIAAEIMACRGWSGSHGYYFPWGAQYGVDSCDTPKLIAAVGMGAAGATVVAAILAALGVEYGAGIAVAVAAVLAFGAAALGVCQANSDIGAIWLNYGGTPAVSCWSQ